MQSSNLNIDLDNRDYVVLSPLTTEFRDLQMPNEKDPLPAIPSSYDWQAFRENAHQTIDLIVDYQQALSDEAIPCQSSVEPGYLLDSLEQEAPEEGQEWTRINEEIKQKIIPGMTHWQHPNFFAYFPSQVSPPALLGDMVANAMNQPGFTWASSPAATELEMVTMEWLRRAFEFPESMSWKSEGGGVLQPTATEAMITSLIAARNRALDNAGIQQDQREEKMALYSRMCVYYSDQSHFCIEKAAKVLAIPYVRAISSLAGADGNRPVDTEALKNAVLEDEAAGRIPIFISANFGATGVCAIDNLREIGQFARKHNIWFNIDAAYAGVVAILPECRADMNGVELADSVLINGSKWFNTMFNCSFHFFTSRKDMVTSLNATGVFLENEQTTQQKVFDLKDYHLGLGRPFRALKLFTTLRSFGLEGMRVTLRRHIALARYTAQQLEDSGLFEIYRVKYGLICFNLKGGEKMEPENQALLKALNDDKNMHLVHTEVESVGTVLRISLAHPQLDYEHMDRVVDKISNIAKEIL